MVAGVVVGRGEADGGLLDGQGAVGLSVKHMFEQIFSMSFVLSDRRTESRSWTSPSPKDGRKRSKEIKQGFFMFFTCGGSCPRTCGIALKGRVEKRRIVVAHRGEGAFQMS